MAYWLIKSDPEDRSFDDLAQEGYKGFEWSGVREEMAFDHFAAMGAGDLALFYHAGDENRFFGILKILAPARPDSTDDAGQWLSVKLAVFLRLITPVSIAQVQNEPALEQLAKDVDEGPSLQPLSFEDWDHVCQLGDMPRTPQSGSV